MQVVGQVYGIIDDLGVFALLTMGYRSILERVGSEVAQSVLLGLLFGFGAIFAIGNAQEVAAGVFVDPRGVMLVLAGPFGGPLAAVLAAVMAGAFRLWMGGLGAIPGVGNIAIAAVAGILFRVMIFRQFRPTSLPQLFALGAGSNLGLVSFLTLPSPLIGSVFLPLLPLIVANFVGAVILGRFLCRERKAFVEGRALQEEAFIDPLTRLPNRRMLERKIDPMLDRSRRDGHPVSILVIDIDHFKSVNDRFGHDVGDVILQEVANVVRVNIRHQDVVARFGGEEIVVAMADTTIEAASIVANRIRSIVDRDVFHLSRATAGVTVSIGVATDRGSAISFKTLFKSADEALYRAKELGRNRVERAGGAMLPQPA